MITAEEVKRLQHQLPFIPFNIHLSDGGTFRVLHSEQIMVLRHKVVIALPETAEIAERTENLAMLHITSLEEMAQPAS